MTDATPPELDSELAFDKRRSLVFWCAAAMAAASAGSRLSAGARGIEVWWELASMVVCVAAAWLSRQPARRVRTLALGGLAVFFLASTPVVALRLGSPTLVVLVLALPLALSIVFLDRVVVVAAVCATGMAVNTLTLVRLGWSTTNLVHATVSMIALYGTSLLGAMEFVRLRRLERVHQQSLRRAAAIQLQSERLIVLGTLAASVGHEINNPLAFVVANVSLLEETEPNKDPDRRQVWEETRTGLARISTIVADLRGLARASPAGVDAADLERLIRQAARMTSLRSRGALQIEVQVEPHLPACLMDEQRVAQVLLNIAVNACDALENAPAPRIRFRAARQGDRVCVSIEDNGPGVPAEVKPRLFTPFFTTKPAGAGTGLGLALSREYLEAFGGSIDCADAPGGGACFRVWLPIAPTPGPAGTGIA